MRGTQGLPSCLPTPIDMVKAHYECELDKLKAITEQMAAALEGIMDGLCVDPDYSPDATAALDAYRAWEAKR